MLETIQAVPVKTWAAPDQIEYGIEYKGRAYPLHGDEKSGRHYIQIGG